jgi:hypothetical protein
MKHAVQETFACFEMGPPLRLEEGPEYYGSLPFYEVTLAGTPPLTRALKLTHSTLPIKDRGTVPLRLAVYCQSLRLVSRSLVALEHSLFLATEHCVHSPRVASSLARVIKSTEGTIVILRPRISRPVCLGVRHPSGNREQLFSFLFNYL